MFNKLMEIENNIKKLNEDKENKEDYVTQIEDYKKQIDELLYRSTKQILEEDVGDNKIIQIIDKLKTHTDTAFDVGDDINIIIDKIILNSHNSETKKNILKLKNLRDSILKLGNITYKIDAENKPLSTMEHYLENKRTSSVPLIAQDQININKMIDNITQYATNDVFEINVPDNKIDDYTTNEIGDYKKNLEGLIRYYDTARKHIYDEKKVQTTPKKIIEIKIIGEHQKIIDLFNEITKIKFYKEDSKLAKYDNTEDYVIIVKASWKNAINISTTPDTTVPSSTEINGVNNKYTTYIHRKNESLEEYLNKIQYVINIFGTKYHYGILFESLKKNELIEALEDKDIVINDYKVPIQQYEIKVKDYVEAMYTCMAYLNHRHRTYTQDNKSLTSFSSLEPGDYYNELVNLMNRTYDNYDNELNKIYNPMNIKAGGTLNKKTMENFINYNILEKMYYRYECTRSYNSTRRYNEYFYTTLNSDYNYLYKGMFDKFKNLSQPSLDLKSKDNDIKNAITDKKQNIEKLKKAVDTIMKLDQFSVGFDFYQLVNTDIARIAKDYKITKLQSGGNYTNLKDIVHGHYYPLTNQIDKINYFFGLQQQLVYSYYKYLYRYLRYKIDFQLYCVFYKLLIDANYTFLEELQTNVLASNRYVSCKELYLFDKKIDKLLLLNDNGPHYKLYKTLSVIKDVIRQCRDAETIYKYNKLLDYGDETYVDLFISSVKISSFLRVYNLIKDNVNNYYASIP
jgi:hypothetical protein